MKENDEKTLPKRGRLSIGQVAARRKEQLEKLKEAERRRQEAFREEREKLNKQLAELEAQARQAERKQQIKDRQHVCFLLGEMILQAVLTQGMKKLVFTESDLQKLKADDLTLVRAVVERMNAKASASGSVSNEGTTVAPAQPDLML